MVNILNAIFLQDENSLPYSSTSGTKKRSTQQQHVDSKYGFAGNSTSSKTSLAPNNNAGAVGTQKSMNLANESVDELPLPPHPNGAASISQHQQQQSNNVPSSTSNAASSRYAALPQLNSTSNNKRSQSQPLKDSQGGGNVPELPKVPPKIDRQKKPSRRSATERLFGNGEVSGNYMNSEGNNTSGNGSNGSSSIPHSQTMGNTNRASHHPHSSSSLDRHTHIRDMKMVCNLYIALPH